MGSKGYSDNSEAYLGEFGLVAGVLLPPPVVDEVRAWASTLMDGVAEGKGKVHITDLPPESQIALRDNAFGYVRIRGIPIVYEAIYTEGLHQDFIRARDSLCAAKRSAAEVGMAIPQNPVKTSLHVELLFGALANAVDFGAVMYGREFDIRVISDRIDEVTQDELQARAEELLGPMSGEEALPVFNRQTRTRQDGSFKFHVRDEDKHFPKLNISLAIEVDVTPLTLLADILANAMRHHLLSVAATGAPLMSKSAISYASGRPRPDERGAGDVERLRDVRVSERKPRERDGGGFHRAAA